MNDNPERIHVFTKPTTHVLMVIDRSGSMHIVADDVRGGFNAYLENLEQDTAVTYRITTALFDDNYALMGVGLAPQDVIRLNQRTYRPGGSTALLDAIGRIISDFERSTELRPRDRVLLVVQTDGEENASREYKVEQIRKMITEREATGVWGAVFMGAGPDTWKQAGGMGFSTSTSYARTSEDTRNTYDGLTKMSGAFSRGASTGQAVTDSGLNVEESR